jgi:hypothetical protein
MPQPYHSLAACYAHIGRLGEAREIVARLREITVQVLPNDLPFRNPEHRELLFSGLRLARPRGNLCWLLKGGEHAAFGLSFSSLRSGGASVNLAGAESTGRRMRSLAFGGRGTPRFRHRLIRFRHFIGGSLALASLNLACRDHPRRFRNARHHRS